MIRGVISLAAGDAGTRLIGFFVTVYLARVLGPDSFGVISVGLAVLAYLGHLSGAGIQLLESRNTAATAEVDRSRVGAVMLLRLLLAGTIAALTYLVAAGFLTGDMREAVWLYALMLIPMALSLEWFFQGRESFVALSGSRILTNGVYALFVFLLIATPRDFTLAPLSFVAGSFVGSLLLIGIFRQRHGPLRPVWNPVEWRRILRESVPLSAALLVGQSAINLGPIVIGLLFLPADVGAYSAAMKLIVLLLLLDRVLNSMYLPFVSRIRSVRPDDVPQIVNAVSRVVMAVGVPTAICVFAAADELMVLVFGGGYTGSGLYLRVLLVYFVLTLPNSIFVCTLLAYQKERMYTRVLFTGSILLSVLVCLLALWQGPVGAAIGVAAGELIMVTMFGIAAGRVVSSGFGNLVIRFAGPTIAMAVLLSVSSEISLLYRLPVSVLIFFVVLFITGGLTLQNLNMLRSRF